MEKVLHWSGSMSFRPGAAGAATLLAAACWLPAVAAAQGSKDISGEVLIVLAKEDAGEVDGALATMPALRRPPFNAFLSMKVLSRPKVRLRAGRSSAEVALPNGYRLQLQIEKVTPDGKFQVKAALRKAGENRDSLLLTVLASPGDPFFVAGQHYQDGTLIVGVILGAS